MVVFRVLARTLLACGGTALVAVALTLFGLWPLAMFTTVGGAIWAMGAGTALLDRERDSSGIAAFAGLLIVAIAGIMSLASVETKLWPGTATCATLAAAAEHHWATALAFGDATVRDDLADSAPVWGRHATRVDTVYVAPVVAADWTPQQPVAVWAVARGDSHDECVRRWRERARCGVVVAGFYTSEYLTAVGNARRAHGLRATLDPVFVDWTADPDAALVGAWRTLATIVGIAALALSAVILVVRCSQGLAPGARR